MRVAVLAALLTLASSAPVVIDTVSVSMNATIVSAGDVVTASLRGVPAASRQGCWFGMFPSVADLTPFTKTTGSEFTPPFTNTAPVKFWNCTEVGGAAFTASGNVDFVMHLLNLRQDLTFAALTGMTIPAVLALAPSKVSFRNVAQPAQLHIARTADLSEMRVSWVSAAASPQEVKWGNATGKYSGSASSESLTYTADDVCGAPANLQGFFDPGFLHTAVIKGLTGGERVYYVVGSDDVGYSEERSFKAAVAPSPNVPLRVMVHADMGVTEMDGAHYHWEEPDAYQTISNLEKRAIELDADLAVNIGDLSYATGYLAKWDSFMTAVEPLASTVPYMTGLGNHECDWKTTGTFFHGVDSGGECCVPAMSRFKMPTPDHMQHSGWYSFDQGPLHFVMLSTEFEVAPGSDQYDFLSADLAAVNRSITPWVVVGAHRPMYYDASADPHFLTIEPLLQKAQVDLCLWGHVHNAQRTCPLSNSTCLAPKTAGAYDAPVHAVIGNAGQGISAFPAKKATWSLYQAAEWGWNELLCHNATHMTLNMYGNNNYTVPHDTHTFVRTFPRS